MTINIFIGTSANGEDQVAEMVYEYTLRQNTQANLDIHFTRLSQDKESFWGGWNTSKWVTPFSGFRWAIPEFCEFKGRAIYTDGDMINFRDIEDLYNTDLQGKTFGCRRGTRFGIYEVCVMLIDCEKAKDYLWPLSKLKRRSDNHIYFRDKIIQSDELVQEIDSRWNCFDGEGRELNDIYQLHYTNMSTQPWRPAWYQGEHKEHPRKELVDLFWQKRDEAIEKGLHPPFIDKRYGPYHIIGQ